MVDLIRYAKAWAVVLLITRLLLVMGVVAVLGVMLFGDGGEIKLTWSFKHEAKESSPR